MGDNTQLQLFRVYKTCWEMLHSRNYMVGEDKLTMNFEAFESEFGTGDAVRDSLTIVAARVGDSQDQVCSSNLQCKAVQSAKSRGSISDPASRCVDYYIFRF